MLTHFTVLIKAYKLNTVAHVYNIIIDDNNSGALTHSVSLTWTFCIVQAPVTGAVSGRGGVLRVDKK